MGWDESISMWEGRIGKSALAEILREHIEKPPTYIEKCVQTAEKRGKRETAHPGMYTERQTAKDRLRYAIDAWDAARPSSTRTELWYSDFADYFGFTTAEFSMADDEQCEAWLKALEVTA